MTPIRGFPSKDGLLLPEIVEDHLLRLDNFHEALPLCGSCGRRRLLSTCGRIGYEVVQKQERVGERTPAKGHSWQESWTNRGVLRVAGKRWGVGVEVEEIEGLKRGVGGRIRTAVSMDERCGHRDVDREVLWGQRRLSVDKWCRFLNSVT